MTQDERIDMLEARLIAHGIALQLLVQDASPETKASLARCADSAFETVYPEMTDLQRAQIERVLQLLCQ